MKLEIGLRKLKGKTKKQKIFAFDVETYNNNKNFLCASIVGDDYLFFTKDKEEFKKELALNRIFRNGYIFATNLMFDFYSIFSIKESLEWFKLIERTGNIILASTYISYNSKDKNFYKDVAKGNKKDYYKINFFDSLNHIKLKVSKMGELVNLNKLKQPENLGEKPKNKEEWDYMKAYNIRDSTITYKFMKFLEETYNYLGGNLKSTVSASALDLYRRKYHAGFWNQETEDRIKFQFNAYYGGRTEAFKRGLFTTENYSNIFSYDVNSLYPYCLSNFKYPYIKDSYFKEKASLNQIENFNGLCYSEIKIPKDEYIPLLPLRKDKLLFPVGIIKGYYDFYTLRKALSLGYEILDTGKALIYEHTFNPFKKYVNDLYNLRKKYKAENNSMQLGVKLMLNSFYGKLAYKYFEKERLGTMEDYLNAGDDITTYPTRDKDIFRLLFQDGKAPSYVFPILPLYVTAYARGVMYDFFKNTGKERVLYTDTDCIFTNRKLNTSDELGKLKLEHKFNELLIIKPKFYGGLVKDKEIIKVKGLYGALKSYSQFKDFIKNDNFSVKRTHFRKLRSSIGFNDKFVNQIYTQVKEMDLNDNKRKWAKNKFTLNIQDSQPINI